MARPVKFAMVVDRRTKPAAMLASPALRLSLHRPILVGATMLFWAAVVVGIRLLAA
jgi:hypothetical protein